MLVQLFAASCFQLCKYISFPFTLRLQQPIMHFEKRFAQGCNQLI